MIALTYVAQGEVSRDDHVLQHVYQRGRVCRRGGGWKVGELGDRKSEVGTVGDSQPVQRAHSCTVRLLFSAPAEWFARGRPWVEPSARFRERRDWRQAYVKRNTEADRHSM